MRIVTIRLTIVYSNHDKDLIAKVSEAGRRGGLNGSLDLLTMAGCVDLVMSGGGNLDN